MKFTEASLVSAYSNNCLTLDLIFSKRGLKNDIIRAGGMSTDDAPLFVK